MSSPITGAEGPTSFVEALAPTLSLSVGSTVFKISSGDIRAIQLEMNPWGFTCEVSFWQQDNEGFGGPDHDALFEPFTGHEPMEATLTVASDYLKRSLKKAPEAISVQGLVQGKAVEEHAVRQVKQHPVLYRRYTITFADVAAVLWRQHWPTALYINKTFKDVLEDHKGESITLEHKLSALTVRHPVLCLGLGAGELPASFYDLLVWYLERWHGHLLYDPATQTYLLEKEKPAEGEAVALPRGDVDRWQLHLDEPPRWETHLLNGSTLDPGNEAITQERSVAGVRRDLLVRTDIAKVFSDRKTVESTRLEAAPKPEVRLSLARFPEVEVTPGSLLKLEGPGWSKKLSFNGAEHRVRRMGLRAQASEAPDEGHKAPVQTFHITLEVDLEAREDARPRLPPFVRPTYPIEVEGLVVSEKNDEEALSWHLFEDQDTSEELYEVKIPLWEEQVVVAPFLPGMMPGHLYFPAYKGERVLMALYFDHAEIRRFLDWRPGARLAQDTQGNQLFMGLTETDSTSVKHVYEDDKPVFQVHRRHEKDLGTLRIEEGTMILRIEEET